MISKKEVERLADMTRIAMTDDELAKFAEDLNEILDRLMGLAEVDTQDVDTTYQAAPLEEATREDVITSSLPAEEVLKNAPEAVDGYFRVPRIVD
ncbi:MAG: Asp-tRNA(Asn)/Glu-tRNA(Gln) amidotransferase subunit GatC [Limnochordia bacterium]|nr:Asp-tRNA(Asn)/Glu-tRNA(Gln) amidotransferase subunit GatC [Limnochordia bacterium]MDD2630698.1 Asp-tRNA(Asn)/Glu-tRNA(Gln) amidotransferase subunit GatC [Limnochordia bacterium]MDD4518351.1 Asp-tRNA(Asn)/Glu-tRNA(Gln) amidotransferase subunit GatC [Limnochordia bacterium]